MAGNVFNGGIQNQETISVMGSEVILYVLLGHPMWCERSVSKPLIGKRHNDLGDVCPLLSLAAVLASFVLLCIYSRETIVNRCSVEPGLLCRRHSSWKGLWNSQWRIDIWRVLSRIEAARWRWIWVIYPVPLLFLDVNNVTINLIPCSSWCLSTLKHLYDIVSILSFESCCRRST